MLLMSAAPALASALLLYPTVDSTMTLPGKMRSEIRAIATLSMRASEVVKFCASNVSTVPGAEKLTMREKALSDSAMVVAFESGGASGEVVEAEASEAVEAEAKAAQSTMECSRKVARQEGVYQAAG